MCGWYSVNRVFLGGGATIRQDSAKENACFALAASKLPVTCWRPMTLESALRARTLTAPPPPDTPPPPASLTPPQPLIDKTPLRQYRFPTRPSTSYIELRPTGSLSEKFIVDMKLAAGPSARRGHVHPFPPRAVHPFSGAAPLSSLQRAHQAAQQQERRRGRAEEEGWPARVIMWSTWRRGVSLEWHFESARRSSTASAAETTMVSSRSSRAHLCDVTRHDDR